MSRGQGRVYQLPLTFDGKAIFAREYKGYYRFYALKEGVIDVLQNLVEANTFYGNYVHKSVPKESKWEVVGRKLWTDEEIKQIPYLFRQNIFNYTDCALIHPSEVEAVPVSYEKCIGLEGAGVFDYWESLSAELMAKLKGVANMPWDEFYQLKIPGLDKER